MPASSTPRPHRRLPAAAALALVVVLAGCGSTGASGSAGASAMAILGLHKLATASSDTITAAQLAGGDANGVGAADSGSAFIPGSRPLP